MIHSMVDRRALSSEIKGLIEGRICGDGAAVAYYVRRSDRMVIDQHQLDLLRLQVKEDLIDYFSDLVEELLDDITDPGSFLEEFFDYTPPKTLGFFRALRLRYDDDWGDMEYHRRRDEGLL